MLPLMSPPALVTAIVVVVIAAAWLLGARTGTLTAMEVSRDVDLSGKLALVTGGPMPLVSGSHVKSGPTSGIGRETARVLAARGCRVVLACRDIARGNEVAQSIAQQHQGATIDVMELDLASFDSIRAFSERFLKRGMAIDILVNNAGVSLAPQHMKTRDGIDIQLGVNHFGHFLLTMSVMPALCACSGVSRVVVVASKEHAVETEIDFDDMMLEKNDAFSRWRMYGRSKLFNVLFARELQRLSDERGLGITANAVHPGVIPTNVSRHLWGLHGLYTWGVGLPLLNRLVKTVEEGAATTVYAATAPLLEGRGGLYLSDCAEAPGSEMSRDIAVAHKLWVASERVVGLGLDDALRVPFRSR